MGKGVGHIDEERLGSILIDEGDRSVGIALGQGRLVDRRLLDDLAPAKIRIRDLVVAAEKTFEAIEAALVRQRRGLPAEMPFAEHAGRVARRL